MLLYGRLVVTRSGLMLDEVRSLLQKSLRRQETALAYQATRELIGPEKDQLPWKSIVTFMFEDHCLNHVDVYKKLYKLYLQKDKFKCIELISRCYTCRHSACLQVVALDDDYRLTEDVWHTDLPLDAALVDLVRKHTGGISFNLLIAHIVKYWQEKNAKVLAGLFLLVNMVAKVEKRKLTKAGVTYLIDSSIKKPTVHHLVISALHKNTTDEYMAALTLVCFKLAAIEDTPQGLVMFSFLSQLMYKESVTKATTVDTVKFGTIDWVTVGKLEDMPSWAVDKHTFRGKFGKPSEHIFLKKHKQHLLSREQLLTFHGPRPKADLKAFFDVGCVCNNDILPENPIWQAAQHMYLKQKPSLQKCAKMTRAKYEDMRDKREMVFEKGSVAQIESTTVINPTNPRKRKSEQLATSHNKRSKLETSDTISVTTSGSGKEKAETTQSKKGPTSSTTPKGPLLQLPTGSGKVYTRLNIADNKVWKGPYKSKERQNLCVFYHRTMKEVFGDAHTMSFEQSGPYIIFRLVKSEERTPAITHRAFYDCIGKCEVSEAEGEFVERSSLGIVQLHKLDPGTVADLPLSVWAHFAFRYILNIGDTGLYNAIATHDLREIYGIDMEETRARVKGNDVMNMLFGKMPRKPVAKEIQTVLLTHIEAFCEILDQKYDFHQLDILCKTYGIKDEIPTYKKRLENLKKGLEQSCLNILGI